MTEASYTLLGDGPYEQEGDPLNFDDLAKGLVGLLENAHASTPMTLGIQAPWGMGKSSLMLRMKNQLDGYPDVFRTVWFNAWTFEGEGVLEGMIKTVLEQLDPNILRKVLRNKKFTATLQAIASIASHMFGISKFVNDIWEAVEVDPRARNQLRDMLTDAMEEWAHSSPKGSMERTIVVFIDDLDRCSPDNVFAVFEAIKLYLDAPGLVFIVGMDSEIVSEAILEHKKYSQKVTSEQYVEKIVQIGYNIPAATPDQMINLFDTYCSQSGTSDLFDEDSKLLVLERSNNNPRRIKRFINVFIIENQLNPESTAIEPKLLIKIIMLGMYYRAFCRLFDPEAEIDLISEFLDYEKARLNLQGQQNIEEGLQGPIREVFKRYDLSEPASYGDGATATAQLDSRVPEDFVDLAGRSHFIKLVRSVDLADRGTVAAHIRRVGEAVSREDSDHSVDKRSFDFNGAHILWLDDNPDWNLSYRQEFESAGAHVEQVVSTREAVAALSGQLGRFNVLISDVKRGDDRSAGFNDLPEIRELTGFSGPVVFFVGSVRLQDRRTSAELGTDITNDPLELFALVDQAFAMYSKGSTRKSAMKSTLHHKMEGLPEAEVRAGVLLENLGPDAAVEKLVSEGFGTAMAEAAVAKHTNAS